MYALKVDIWGVFRFVFMLTVPFGKCQKPNECPKFYENGIKIHWVKITTNK